MILEKEQWRSINGYEELYEISNKGRVRSISKKGRRKSLILKPGNCRGYLRVILTKNKIRKMFSVHRLVAFAFISNSKNKSQVNHINGNRTDNSKENLEWNTNGENKEHGNWFRLSGLGEPLKIQK